jgi:hypothetical protein
LNSPDDSVECVAPHPSRGLWVICVLIGSAVLLMWAAGRIKPLVIYPLLVGSVLGVWARSASAVCQMPRLRWWTILPTCCAMAVTIGSFALAAQRLAADIKPANPLAEQLLKQFEQQPQPASIAPRAASPFWSYLHERYRSPTFMRTGTWLIAELLVAAMACLAVMKISWPARSS